MHTAEAVSVSPFGGLWIDRTDAAERIDAKRRRGEIDTETAERLERFRTDGLVMVPGAVPGATVDRVLEDIDSLWRTGHPETFVSWHAGKVKHVQRIRPELRREAHKILDLHAISEAAREAIFAPPVRGLLEALFEQPPLAFQSLCMEFGSQHAAHQDTAFVRTTRPLEFIGVWLALEDVRPASGELFYYTGSHRFDDYLWLGKHKAMPPRCPAEEVDRYFASLTAQAQRRGIEPTLFRPRKGDVLFWHADLAHGGSREIASGVTRWSLVTHFCPLDNDPVYFRKELHSAKQRHASGGYWCHTRFRDSRPWRDLWRKARVWGKLLSSRLANAAGPAHP